MNCVSIFNTTKRDYNLAVTGNKLIRLFSEAEVTHIPTSDWDIAKESKLAKFLVNERKIIVSDMGEVNLTEVLGDEAPTETAPKPKPKPKRVLDERTKITIEGVDVTEKIAGVTKGEESASNVDWDYVGGIENKTVLQEYAETFGVKLKANKSLKNMVKDFEEAYQK